MRASLAALFLGLATPAAAAELTVFAAASLKTALDAVIADWDHEVVAVYAGTPVLARQIAAGAPADVFISANQAWMDQLETTGFLVEDTRRDLLGNRLVLIGFAPGSVEIGPDLDLTQRLDGGRLAMALVDAVPAGLYGRMALQHFGLWSGLQSRVAQTDNVRATLALVATGGAPLGIVYASDAVAEPRVHRLAIFPEASHPPIVYPAAAIVGGHVDLARTFLEYLETQRPVFEAFGFRASESGQ